MRVLITREAEAATTLVQMLAAESFEVVVQPVTETVFSSAELNVAVSGYSWVVFTSRNGVVGFAQYLKKSRQSLPDNCRIAAVGEATADTVAKELGRKTDLIPLLANARELARSLLDRISSRRTRVLFPTAKEGLPDFARICQAAGVVVDTFPVYETHNIEAAELTPQLHHLASWDVAVFHAPSAVRAFADAWALPWLFEAVAVGATTGNALCEAGMNRLWIASSPKPEDIVSTLREVRSFLLERETDELPQH